MNSEYVNAAENGDTETAQKYVDEGNFGRNKKTTPKVRKHQKIIILTQPSQLLVLKRVYSYYGE